MATLTNEQKKARLSQSRYFLTLANGQRLKGVTVGYCTDHLDRFGAIVVFSNGTRSFWGVNDNTLTVYDLGPPPPRPNRPRLSAR